MARIRISRRLAAVAAGVGLGAATLVAAAPAAAVATSVDVYCESHLGLYVCDVYVYGFDTVSTITWKENNFPRSAATNSWVLTGGCVDARIVVVSATVSGTRNGSSITKTGSDSFPCLCEGN